MTNSINKMLQNCKSFKSDVTDLSTGKNPIYTFQQMDQIFELSGCFLRIIKLNEEFIIINTDVQEPNSECVLMEVVRRGELDIDISVVSIHITMEDGTEKQGIYNPLTVSSIYKPDEVVIQWLK